MGVTTINFQPGTVIQLLGIERSIFRYWRSHLDPNPEQKSFDKEKLFAYRLLTCLIQDKHLPVHVLELFDLGPIFRWKEFLSAEDLQSKWGVLHESQGVIEYVDASEAFQHQAEHVDVHAFFLKLVYEKHIASLIWEF